MRKKSEALELVHLTPEDLQTLDQMKRSMEGGELREELDQMKRSMERGDYRAQLDQMYTELAAGGADQ